MPIVQPPSMSPNFGFAGFLAAMQTLSQVKTQMKPETEMLPSQMRSSLQKSVESIALQKGHNVISAYESIDIIPYEDKKKIDLLIIPEVQLSDEENSLTPTVEPPKGPHGTLKKGTVQYTGTLKIKGQLILQIIEPLTKEKLFIKSIPYAYNPVTIETVVEYGEEKEMYQAASLAYQSVQRAKQNAINQALEDAYDKLIDFIKTHLPGGEEAVNLAKQARELKTIKRY